MGDQTRNPGGRGARRWWQGATVYQVYLRSFADGDGDGTGDFTGLTSRLGYLHDLGVDAVWITPFYPSPLADGGYDVADYRQVDPRLGTLAQFDGFVRRAHALGMRVLVDIVPNHTSDRHPWFRKALAEGPASEAAGRYIFRRGKGPGYSRPPTNWQSNFGGSAWQPLGDDWYGGWYYLHLFAREQPDLNWSDPSVREEFLSILRFWCAHGADGFRVDVSHGLAKDLSEPLRDRPNPYLFSPQAADGSDPLWDRDETHGIYRGWRRLLDSYDPPRYAVGESWTPFTPRVFQYARPDELGAVFDFSLEKSDWDRDEYRHSIDRTARCARGVGSVPTWVLGNHDVPRIASRLGLPKGANVEDWVTSDGTSPHVDPALAAARARAAALVQLSLPGTAFIYQGDELGLPEDLDLAPDQIVDPNWERSGHRFKGRDGCRIPLPWKKDAPAFGFSADVPGAAAPATWLPQPDWFRSYAVDGEEGDPASPLSLYRRALALRRIWVAHDVGSEDAGSGENADFRPLGFVWEEGLPARLGDAARSDLLAWRLPSGLCVLVNFSDSHSYRIPEGYRLLLGSDPSAENGLLAPDSAVWLSED